MKYSKYTEANRAAWNAAMPFHRQAMNEVWDRHFANQDFIWQKDPELAALKEMGISGKDVIHLCCNNGIELLSLKRLGAGRCVGVDISDEAIQDARNRAERFGIACEFVQSNVYEVPQNYYNSFDLVYITIGAFCWLPDLTELFKVVRALLKPTGKLFIYEQHPFTQMLPFEVKGNRNRPELTENYFQAGEISSNEGLDYYGNCEYESPLSYEFVHTLSDIFSAILDSGLQISKFKEYDHDISNGFAWVKNTGLSLPLSYILCADAV
jgi:ubiquinone/menaquinone biosynthesis C-methylase UbiE